MTKSATESIAEVQGPRSFGAFYPTGHLVIFANKGDAERAREALVAGGYDEHEIVVLSSDDAALCNEDMLPHVSLLAGIGSEIQHMRRHLDLARQGYEKMIVYAPTEHESKRVMNVARRFDR